MIANKSDDKTDPWCTLT